MQSRRIAALAGCGASDVAEAMLGDAGFEIVAKDEAIRGAGIRVGFVARSAEGTLWHVDVGSAPPRYPGGERVASGRTAGIL